MVKIMRASWWVHARSAVTRKPSRGPNETGLGTAAGRRRRVRHVRTARFARHPTCGTCPLARDSPRAAAAAAAS